MGEMASRMGAEVSVHSDIQTIGWLIFFLKKSIMRLDQRRVYLNSADKFSPSMDSHVLVLNQDYQPLSICSVQRSMKLLFLEKAELLYDEPGKRIRTVRNYYTYPSVIRLRNYIRIPYHRIVLSRRNIMKRDRFECQYCGGYNDLTLDHVLPRSRGGRDQWENLVTACNRCNVRKGNRTPAEAKMPLRREPFRPIPITFFRERSGGVNESWKPYLYM